MDGSKQSRNARQFSRAMFDGTGGYPWDYGADEKAWDSTRTEPNVFILFYLFMCLFDLKQAVTLVNMWAT